jgi:hypothetical protein
MTDEWWFEKNFRGKRSWLNRGTISECAWSNWEKPRKASIKIAVIPTWNRTEHFLNVSMKCYCYVNALGRKGSTRFVLHILHIQNLVKTPKFSLPASHTALINPSICCGRCSWLTQPHAAAVMGVHGRAGRQTKPPGILQCYKNSRLSPTF